MTPRPSLSRCKRTHLEQKTAELAEQRADDDDDDDADVLCPQLLAKHQTASSFLTTQKSYVPGPQPVGGATLAELHANAFSL